MKTAEELYNELMTEGVWMNIEFDDPTKVYENLKIQSVGKIKSFAKEVAEKAFKAGVDRKTYLSEPYEYHPPFKDYWKSVTNKPQQ